MPSPINISIIFLSVEFLQRQQYENLTVIDDLLETF